MYRSSSNHNLTKVRNLEKQGTYFETSGLLLGSACIPLRFKSRTQNKARIAKEVIAGLNTTLSQHNRN